MRMFLFAAGLVVTAFAIGYAQAPDRHVRGGLVQGRGTLVPEAVVEVNSPVHGKILKIHLAGAWNAVVKKGEPLAEIDAAPFEANFRIARANVDSADAVLRLAKLRLSQATPVEIAEIAVAEAKVARSRASLDRAKFDLDACELLRLPIDGVILDNRAIVGQFANPTANVPSLS